MSSGLWRFLHPHAMRAGAFKHWILGQREMTATLTQKPFPVAVRGHGHELSVLYAVRASDDLWHVSGFVVLPI